MTIIVIGAGFAGLAAAVHLRQAGQEVVVLEGRDRIGGRAHTAYDIAGFPVELGAELIHGSDVITWQWVRQLGLDTIHWRKGRDSLVRLEDGRLLTMPEAREASAALDQARSWIATYQDINPQDEDLATYLQRIGFQEEHLAYVRRMTANAIGDDLRFLSAQAHIPMLREAGERAQSSGTMLYSDDYRIPQGYGAIYQAMAAGLDIHLKSVVTGIHWSDDDVRIYTASGREYHGECAVITLPVGVLLEGQVEFAPRMPSVKRGALDGLRMAPAAKMIYTFAEPLTPPTIAAIYSKRNPPMWWTPSFGRDGAQTVWSAFFTGDWARELLAMGEKSALRAGLETLRIELDRANLHYEEAHFINWSDDPFSLGGYSIALPTGANAREMLAEATHPLYWAGEGTAPNNMAATVHGAYFSGQRAAQEILSRMS